MSGFGLRRRTSWPVTRAANRSSGTRSTCRQIGFDLDPSALEATAQGIPFSMNSSINSFPPGNALPIVGSSFKFQSYVRRFISGTNFYRAARPRRPQNGPRRRDEGLEILRPRGDAEFGQARIAAAWMIGSESTSTPSMSKITAVVMRGSAKESLR